VVDWAALIGVAAFGFVIGMTTAWRIATVETTKAWVGDLRHRFMVKQADREKEQQLRHDISLCSGTSPSPHVLSESRSC
jgi:hypothetical protein